MSAVVMTCNVIHSQCRMRHDGCGLHKDLCIHCSPDWWALMHSNGIWSAAWIFCIADVWDNYYLCKWLKLFDSFAVRTRIKWHSFRTVWPVVIYISVHRLGSNNSAFDQTQRAVLFIGCQQLTQITFLLVRAFVNLKGIYNLETFRTRNQGEWLVFN